MAISSITPDVAGRTRYQTLPDAYDVYVTANIRLVLVTVHDIGTNYSSQYDGPITITTPRQCQPFQSRRQSSTESERAEAKLEDEMRPCMSFVQYLPIAASGREQRAGDTDMSRDGGRSSGKAVDEFAKATNGGGS